MRPRWIAGLVSTLVLGATVPAFAQVMPLAGSSHPPRARPAGDAGQDSAERDAAFLIAGLGAGQEANLAVGLQLGWMFTPWLGVFASLDGLVGEATDASLRGLGVRLASGAVFVEGGIAAMTVSSECDFNTPCTQRSSHIGFVGAGVEFIHLRHFAFDLHGRVIADGRGARMLGGLGLGFYY